MSFDLAESYELLSRTPRVLDNLLRGTSAEWHARNEGAETWSAADVIGHFIHGEETDWIPRARIILEDGGARAFEPFDRFAQETRFAGWPIEMLLDRFAELRAANLETARGWKLTEEQLDLRGTHPDFGAVTLRELIATWVAHDLNHLGQISRVLAKRHLDDVGPWRAYLSILQR